MIEPAEESRLTVNAVLHAMGNAADVRRGTVADRRGRRRRHPADLAPRRGDLRLGQLRPGLDPPPGNPGHQPGAGRSGRRSVAPSDRQHAAAIKTSLPLGEVEHLIAVGGDARFAAAQIGKPSATGDLSAVGRKAFDRLCAQCAAHTAAELARIYGIPFADAETLVPALLVYQALLARHAGHRDARLQRLHARRAAAGPDRTLEAEEAQAAAQQHHPVGQGDRREVSLRRDPRRARGRPGACGSSTPCAASTSCPTASACCWKWRRSCTTWGRYVGSQLAPQAQLLPDRELRDLRAAPRANCRSWPWSPATTAAARPSGRTRNTWACRAKSGWSSASWRRILRVADALDRGHVQQVRDVRVRAATPNELSIYVPGVPDLTLERRALAAKADLFEDVYGLQVRLEEADAAASTETPT